MSTIYEDPTLFERQSVPDEPWTQTLEAIKDKYAVKTAFDFGCGLGVDVVLMLRAGIDARGVDGSKALRRHVLFPRDRYIVGDLTTRLHFPADLIWCREVAEHLAAEHAGALVANIVRNALRVVYFTAAPPGQIGYQHINPQPLDYWLALFAERGLEVDTELTALNKQNPVEDDRVNGVVLRSEETEEDDWDWFWRADEETDS